MKARHAQHKETLAEPFFRPENHSPVKSETVEDFFGDKQQEELLAFLSKTESHPDNQEKNTADVLPAEALLAALPGELDLSSCRVGRWADDMAIVFARKAVEVEPYSMHFRNHLGALLRKRGDFEEAEDVIREGFSIIEEWGDGYMQLAFGKEAQGNLDEAIALAEKAIAVEPYQLSHREFLCHLLSKKRAFDTALDRVSEGLRINPYWGIGHRRRSYIYDAMGEIDKAILAARKAIAIEEYNLSFRAHLCALLRKKRDFETAFQVAEEALRLNPYWSEGHRQLSCIHDAAHDLERAIAEARIAAKTHSCDLGFKAHLANLLRRDGKLEEAVTTAREGLAINPGWGEGYRQMSLAHNARAERNAALEEAHMATRVEPYTLSLKTHLCNLLRENGDWDGAVAVAQEGLAVNPCWSEGYKQISYVRDAHGELDAAITYAEKAVQAEPHILGHRTYLCTLLRRKMPDQAVKVAQEGLAIYSRWAEGHKQLSLVHDARKQLDAAIAEARKAMEAEPYSLSYRAHLCTLLRKKGCLDEAMLLAREGLKIYPGWDEAYRQMAYVHDARKQRRASIVCVRRAWQLNPEAGGHGNRLADLYRECGELDKVVNVVKTALARNVWQSWAHKQVAYVHREHKEMPQALYEARLACSLAPRDRACVELLHSLLLETGDVIGAKKLLNDTFKLLPGASWLTPLQTQTDDRAKEQNNKAQCILDEALIRFTQEDYNGALAKVEEAVALNPELGAAYDLRAQIYEAQGEKDKATACATQAYALSLDVPEYGEKLAERYRTRGDVDRLEALAREALDHNPDQAWAYRELSRLHQDRKEQDKALSYARKAMECAPDDREAVEQLLTLLCESGERDEAEDIVNAFLELHPDAEWSHVALARLLATNGRLRQAVSHAEQFTIKDPSTVVLLKEVLLRKLDEDMAQGRSTFDEDPDARPLVESLVRVLLKAGDANGAAAIAEEAIHRVHDQGWPYKLLAEAHEEKGELAEAVTAVTKAVMAVSVDASCLACHNRIMSVRDAFVSEQKLQAEQLAYEEAWDNVSMLCDTVLAVQPNLAWPHFLQSQADEVSGNLKNALSEARKAYELEPEAAENADRLADMLRLTGDLSGAEILARKALQLNPGQGWAHRQLSLSCYADTPTAALAAARSAVALAPTDRRCVEHLVNLLRSSGDTDAAEAVIDAVLERLPEAGWAYALRTLGCLSRGARSEAIEYARKALELDPCRSMKTLFSDLMPSEDREPTPVQPAPDTTEKSAGAAGLRKNREAQKSSTVFADLGKGFGHEK